jgi:hypothetical protein
MRDMSEESLISTLQKRLREARAFRGQQAARLAALDDETRSLRAEIAEIDAIVAQTEAALVRLLSVLTGGAVAPPMPSDAEIEDALSRDFPNAHASSSVVDGGGATWGETLTNRFADRTITQATTILLREARAPLHVNEIYQRLRQGGFRFTGENPTISVAVSLNRNGRFRKVAPGTFDLMIRDASKAL